MSALFKHLGLISYQSRGIVPASQGLLQNGNEAEAYPLLSEFAAQA